MWKSKAIVGIQVFVIVAAIIIITVVIVNLAVEKTSFVRIEGRIGLIVDNEDKGTGMISLLKTNKAGIVYSEILGNQMAVNTPENLDYDLVNTLDLTYPRLNLVVMQDNEFVERYGIEDNNIQGFLFSDLALPGGLKGKVGIK